MQEQEPTPPEERRDSPEAGPDPGTSTSPEGAPAHQGVVSTAAPATGVARAVLIVSITLGVLLAAGVATVGVIGSQGDTARQQAAEASRQAQQARRSGPLAVPPVPAPEAASKECEAVLAALPSKLRVDGDTVGRRELVQPAPKATVAWGDAHHDPVTLRCGISAPAELKPTSRLVTISGVSWLPISQGGTTTWLAVDRPVYVALTLSQEAGSGPVQGLSEILTETLPKQDPFQ